MANSPPQNMDEYTARFMESQRVSGSGVEGVTQHFPCPFCAAPDWFVVRLIDFSAPGEPGTYNGPDATCVECERTARFVQVRSTDGGILGELVQVGGADPPDWLIPPPRRESA